MQVLWLVMLGTEHFYSTIDHVRIIAACIFAQGVQSAHFNASVTVAVPTVRNVVDVFWMWCTDGMAKHCRKAMHTNRSVAFHCAFRRQSLLGVVLSPTLSPTGISQAKEESTYRFGCRYVNMYVHVWV